jgi:membrane-bound lytic murein transglycosylase B
MYDSDGGELDGDVVWDRAVGPLQFIPTTWELRGRDGDGDGWADPQNIYDAAYSAGRYLCALGGDLSSRTALRRAYFGYNNSTAYVDAVISHADRYAAFALPGTPAVVSAVENAG